MTLNEFNRISEAAAAAAHYDPSKGCAVIELWQLDRILYATNYGPDSAVVPSLNANEVTAHGKNDR